MALVSKILEATLTAGNTTVTFTDTDIPNSLIRVFSSNPDIIPESRTLIGNTLTVVYPVQVNNIGIALEIVKQGLDIVDDLTSTDTDKALSAKQGKTLKDIIDGLPSVITNISDMDDVDITDIETGQVLAWNGTDFVNVDQSSATSNIYSYDETVVGTYDGKPLYRKIITGTFSTSETLVSNQIYSASIPVSVSNIDKLFADCDHSYYSISGAIRGFIGIIISENNEVQPITRFSRSNATYYITIEYTKTTD